MAKLSELIPCVAKVTGVAESSVAVHARHLRAARLISTSGRGPGGAEMTSTDCAALLISLIGTDQAKNGPDIINIAKRTKPIESIGVGKRETKNYNPIKFDTSKSSGSFFSDVENIISMAIRDELGDLNPINNIYEWGVEITAERPSLSFRIRYWSEKFDIKKIDLHYLSFIQINETTGASLIKSMHGDMRISSRIGTITIAETAKLLRG